MRDTNRSCHACATLNNFFDITYANIRTNKPQNPITLHVICNRHLLHVKLSQDGETLCELDFNVDYSFHKDIIALEASHPDDWRVYGVFFSELMPFVAGYTYI